MHDKSRALVDCPWEFDGAVWCETINRKQELKKRNHHSRIKISIYGSMRVAREKVMPWRILLFDGFVYNVNSFVTQHFCHLLQSGCRNTFDQRLSFVTKVTALLY